MDTVSRYEKYNHNNYRRFSWSCSPGYRREGAKTTVWTESGFDVDTSEDITRHVKRTVQTLHPDIDNTNQQLFGDLYQQFVLDNSNRVFYSTPNTEVEPGNQAALGKYLYGDMPSAKEDTVVGNLQRIKDNYRYTLY